MALRTGWGLALLVLLLLGAPGTAFALHADRPLTVPEEELERRFECFGALHGAAQDPVLLVHATASTPEENWAIFLPLLRDRGRTVCTVRLEERALIDIQRNSEYVVYAIRAMAQRSGRTVAVVGHSQGGLEPRWAMRYWHDTRAMVSDVVQFGTPNQGTQLSNLACERWADGCPPAGWQQRQGSAFLGALNTGDETPGDVDYTSMATLQDEVVYPQPQASRLEGARNIVLQDVCPGRVVEHYALAADALVLALMVDAIEHPGPADPARLPAGVCAQPFAAGAGPEDVPAAAIALLALTTAETVAAEPPLRCYVDRSCPTPEPRLIRRCIGDGRLRVDVAGGLSAVRDVNVKFDKRLVHRDTAAPFRRVIDRDTLASTGARRLRAVVYLHGTEAFRTILSRSLPRCGLR